MRRQTAELARRSRLARGLRAATQEAPVSGHHRRRLAVGSAIEQPEIRPRPSVARGGQGRRLRHPLTV